jgi:ArsR family transcriptional regulator, arsenate/arsenite/antimonite-responsive transcriptional repressor
MEIVPMRRELEVLTAPAACCTPIAAPRMSDDEAEVTATVFKALADPARVRIVNLLATTGHAACVCDLTPSLGLSQPTVSHHLKKLTDAGLLHRERRGIWAFYSIEPGVFDRLRTVFETGGAR